jgi:sulfite reductase (NADPH) flavoprotein alpha-component
MTEAASAASPYNRKNPFLSEIIAHEPLTKPGSGKDTRHFVFSLAGGGPRYAPGDSLAIFARNPAALVDETIAALKLDPDLPVKNAKGNTVSFREALAHDYILNRATKKIVSGLAERVPQGEQRNHLMEIADNGEVLNEYVHTRDYVDILREFDEARFESAEAFLQQLSPIPPRLYSIASSLSMHPDEAHLCISIVRYETHGRKKTGLCTGFLPTMLRCTERRLQ